MSVNSAHAPGGGVLLHQGECIILFCDATVLDFDDVRDNAAMHGDKKGRVYLTTHRFLFINNKKDDKCVSFSFPFCTLQGVELEQPLFGANYIRGKVRAQPGGGFTGDAKFKLTFKHGGCIEFGQAMLAAAKLASRNARQGFAPPPYSPFQGNIYPAPPPAYSPPQTGYYGWVPPYSAFPNQPPAGSVFVQEAPPPYPGVAGTPEGQPGAGPAPPVGFYNPGQPGTAYVPPQQPGGGYPPQQQQQGYNGYPPPQQGYPPQQQQGYNGYPPQQGYSGYPPQHQGFPQQQGYNGYPQQQGYPPYNDPPPAYKKNN